MANGAQHTVAQERTHRLFKFLSELNKLGNPPHSRIEEQPWALWLHDLPNHPCVHMALRITAEVEADGPERDDAVNNPDGDLVLRVKRAPTTNAPPPPEPLLDWLKPTWQRIEGPVECLESRNEQGKDDQPVTIKFEDDPERPKALAEWKGKWDSWSIAEKPAREALKVFEKVYALYGQIEREAERVELYVGDGVLEWPRPEGSISHPILLQRIQLEFDPQIPEFTLRDTAHPIDLYSALLRTIKEIEGPTLRKCREEVQAGDFHPLEDESTSGFLQRMIQTMHPQGRLVRGDTQRTGDPFIRRDPVIFLQNRSLGFATAFETVLEQLEQGIAEIPKSILSIVGVDTEAQAEADTEKQPTHHYANEDEQILFTKPANPEQLQIAERLERSGNVLVQGPPGTGKTHTIANLIGHLLATNQTVLVTSHTTKALRVLRDQIVENLRPLCVSVLESDTKAQDQLKAAVEGIVQRLSDSNADRLSRDAEKFKNERQFILSRIKETRVSLSRARSDEYREVVVAGAGYLPSQAARIVAGGRSKDDWIPGPLEAGLPRPLNSGELLELYQSNIELSADDESELTLALPDLGALPTPSQFAAMVAERHALSQKDMGNLDLWHLPTDIQTEAVVTCASCGARWKVPITGRHKSAKCRKCGNLIPLPTTTTVSRDQLQALIGKLEDFRKRSAKAAQIVADAESQKWRLAAVTAGTRGGQETEVWTKLVEMIQTVITKAAAAQESLLAFDPRLDETVEFSEQVTVLTEMEGHVGQGGRLGGFSLMFKKQWKRVLTTMSVNGKPPASLAHIQALRSVAELRELRQELSQRWTRQMLPLGAPTLGGVGESIEVTCGQFCQWISDCLSWSKATWEPLKGELITSGLNWTRLMDGVPAKIDHFGDILRLKDAVTNHVPVAIERCIWRLKLAMSERQKAAIADVLDRAGPVGSCAAVVGDLRESLFRLAPEQYQASYQRLAELSRLKTTLQKRNELLRKLESAANTWAAAVRARQGMHGKETVPGDGEKAWLWRQLEQELESRSQVSMADLHDKLAGYQQDLNRVTGELVDRQAWSAQIARTSVRERQNLVGWLDTIRKIGRGTGRRVPQLRVEARKQLQASRTAVPVWIMPLNRVVENFVPEAGLFDVVIIDEASQSSVLELLAFYLGKKVVVVGDHEQVSPDAVGQNQSQITHLMDEYIRDIPNSHLYDGQLSVYDLARQSFQGTICLREHFRCVPAIIQFSNYLSYQGQIKPLRDATGLSTSPHTIAHRVEGMASGRKVNEIEAANVASLIIAATEHQEYVGKSFGVISLVGDEQAYMIDEILRKRLTPATYEARRIMCGNSAQFQGDERDIMFLSMVDAPAEGPLALRSQPMFQKRYNVAASRARDQMWVVYSLNPETDLKPDDLRRRLIRHASDPSEVTRQLEAASAKAESEFERLVSARLIQEGYRVVPQWRVGYYRIDIVVVGTAAKLAVECDGDRYHPPEQLQDDMLRQAILERLGWTFIRIRGSEFFRDQERALSRLFGTLNRMGIERLGADHNVISVPANDQLIDRVKRRAAEIQREWQEELDFSGASDSVRQADDTASAGK